MSDLLSVIISNSDQHKLSCSNDITNHVVCVMKRDVYPQKMNSCSKIIRGI